MSRIRARRNMVSRGRSAGRGKVVHHRNGTVGNSRTRSGRNDLGGLLYAVLRAFTK